jgi:branched-chain amino acid aminotransferase
MAKIYSQAYFGSEIVPVEEAKLSVASSAVLYGLSVYTVFPISVTAKGLAAFRLRDHFERLLNSARIIGIDQFEKEWTYEKFAGAVKEISVANAFDEDVFVRATVHVSAEVAGTKSRGLPITLSMFAYAAQPILPTVGARLKTSVWRRVPDYAIPSRAKVNGAYVNSVLAKQDALDSGYDDCVFLDGTGHVCELSAANIFIVRGGRLITPGTSSDILEGINRRTILELAADLGIATEERTVDLTELYVADELFACGTSAYTCPILEVDKRVVHGGVAGPLTLKLRALHADLLHGKSEKYLSLLTFL